MSQVFNEGDIGGEFRDKMTTVAGECVGIVERYTRLLFSKWVDEKGQKITLQEAKKLATGCAIHLLVKTIRSSARPTNQPAPSEEETWTEMQARIWKEMQASEPTSWGEIGQFWEENKPGQSEKQPESQLEPESEPKPEPPVKKRRRRRRRLTKTKIKPETCCNQNCATKIPLSRQLKIRRKYRTIPKDERNQGYKKYGQVLKHAPKIQEDDVRRSSYTYAIYNRKEVINTCRRAFLRIFGRSQKLIILSNPTPCQECLEKGICGAQVRSYKNVL